jgi:hypothetical protein
VSQFENAGASDCPLVLIEWVDSARPAPAWQLLTDFECDGVVHCASVGWLIHDGEDVKALAPNMGAMNMPDSLQVSGVIRIPTSCTTRQIRLKETREGAISSRACP